MEIIKVNLAEKLSTFTDHWSPKIIGQLNNQHVKIAKLKGEFVLHQHANEDELFYVIDGKLYIQLEHETLKLNSGEFVIIPRGTPHKPYAPEEVSILLFEPISTRNTGDLDCELTVKNPDQI